jgi:DNA polymerase/3'-5' exonuclease PolX
MNDNIIHNFKKLIFLLKQINKFESDQSVKKINSFRIRQLTHSLEVISTLDYTLNANNVKDLMKLPGIGKGTVARISEILNSGVLEEISYLQSLLSNLNPRIIDELSQVIGIGDKMAVKLIKEHNITSLQDFKKKVDMNIIKVNDQIKLGLKYVDIYKMNIPRIEIDHIYMKIDRILSKLDDKLIFIICGSYRRESPTSNDVDILLVHENVFTKKDVDESSHLMEVVNALHKEKFLVDDLTMADKTKYMGFCRLSDNDLIRRIDIRMMAVESFFPALVYFTGPYEFNREMRLLAKKKGYKLNEYGLTKNGTLVTPITSEKKLFDILGMQYKEPNMR